MVWSHKNEAVQIFDIADSADVERKLKVVALFGYKYKILKVEIEIYVAYVVLGSVFNIFGFGLAILANVERGTFAGSLEIGVSTFSSILASALLVDIIKGISMCQQGEKQEH